MQIRASLARRFACALVVAAGLVTACGSDSTGPGEPPGPFNGTITVQNTSFSPSSVTIAVGDSVTWRWAGGSHSVTQGTTPDPSQDPSRLFDSGVKSSGTFGYRFTSAGTFPYFCRPHFASGMKGTVKVNP